MSSTEANEAILREGPTAARSGGPSSNPRRPKRGTYKPQAETLSLPRASGNAINGLGETTSRQASPFFWHNAFPPAAISPQKQMVRGVERWYVDFDKRIPFIAEAASCGICIAECPWTRPNVRPKLLSTIARRLGEKCGQGKP
jgi:hypothetical protein